jgi:hypothetical protein
LKPSNKGYRKGAAGITCGSVNNVPFPTPAPTPPPTPKAPTPPPTPVAPTPQPSGKPVKVFIMLGQSNMLGEGRKDGMKGGDLEYAVKTEGKYPYLWDQKTGNWSVSKNVRSVFLMGSAGATAGITLFNNEFMTAAETTPAPIVTTPVTTVRNKVWPISLLICCILSVGSTLMPSEIRSWISLPLCLIYAHPDTSSLEYMHTLTPRLSNRLRPLVSEELYRPRTRHWLRPRKLHHRSSDVPQELHRRPGPWMGSPPPDAEGGERCTHSNPHYTLMHSYTLTHFLFRSRSTTLTRSRRKCTLTPGTTSLRTSG